MHGGYDMKYYIVWRSKETNVCGRGSTPHSEEETSDWVDRVDCTDPEIEHWMMPAFPLFDHYWSKLSEGQ